ncbi:MAG: murB [Clostridia bacterium]|jgi:UDP-N-acetylmuramate dehydrogenase|nr:murB [Clostridia bacterium]
MDVTILNDLSLKTYNSFKLESKASLMAFPHNNNGLAKLIQTYEGKKKIILIGKGSNVIFSKKDYSDEYLFVSLKLMDNIELIDEKTISVQGGAKMSDLVWFAIENNIKGLEFLEDIPGTVGGGIIMNAGTYRNTIGKFIKSITYYDLTKNEIISREVEEENFGKRKSYWSENPSIVLSAVLQSEQGDYVESLRITMQEKEKRYMKQPRNYPSAGSVFVRPEKDLKEHVVWELLDKVGLRGYAINGCCFSEKHPGFIVNIGGAEYEDIIELVRIAKERVLEKFDVELNMEWKII